MEQRGRTRQSAAPWNGDEGTTARSLLPLLFLLSIAVLLPSVGQVPNNVPQCGLMFVLITLSLGWTTLHMARPDASFVGRYAGALLIHASSILDTYRWARLQWEFFPSAHKDDDPKSICMSEVRKSLSSQSQVIKGGGQ